MYINRELCLEHCDLQNPIKELGIHNQFQRHQVTLCKAPHALACLFHCPPLYIPHTLFNWNFGSGICMFWLIIDYLLCTASVYNIVLISYDRYQSVSNAVSHNVHSFFLEDYNCKSWVHKPVLYLNLYWEC